MAHPARRSQPETFIHAARRRQLVDAAIAQIAEAGLAGSSTVQIALRAGVSRGVLTHHFADRDDLLDAVVASVYELGHDVVGAAVAAADGTRAKLLAFAGGSVDLYAAHPESMTALREIFAARTRGAEDGRVREARHLEELRDVAALLRAGQAAGELRACDADTMAVLIRGVLDGALRRVRAGAPVAELRDDVVTMIDLAIRREA